VLIKRKYPPLGLALPGGFVDIGEKVEDACKRGDGCSTQRVRA